MADDPELPRDPVEDYFEQLDAALASAPPRPASPDAAVPASEPGPASPVADAFAALLALEDGEPGARPVRLVSGDGEPRITEALVEELTRRILERLAPDAAREVVAQVVSEVAERLVREEIDRIRKKHV